MDNVFDILKERGFIKQCSDEKAVRKIVSKESVTCYIGFDPTAESFHVGSLIPIMALAWMERAGHKPIVLMGGGTALIGDPSGKDKVRKLMTPEEVRANLNKLKKELRCPPCSLLIYASCQFVAGLPVASVGIGITSE